MMAKNCKNSEKFFMPYNIPQTTLIITHPEINPETVELINLICNI